MHRPAPRTALRLLACLAALALFGAPAFSQDDNPHRVEIRKIAKICEGENCSEDKHFVIRLGGDGLDLSAIPGIAELELLGNSAGDNLFFFGGGRGGYLGVQLVGLTDALRAHFGVPEGQGVMVSEVADDTAAWRAGIQAGDVITAVGGERVSSSGALSKIIRSAEPGASVDLEVWRDGRPTTFTAQLEERESLGRTRTLFLDCNDGEEDCNRVTVRGLDVGCDGGDCDVLVRCEDGQCTCTVNGEDKDCESLDELQWHDRRLLRRQQQ